MRSPRYFLQFFVPLHLPWCCLCLREGVPHPEKQPRPPLLFSLLPTSLSSRTPSRPRSYLTSAFPAAHYPLTGTKNITGNP